MLGALLLSGGAPTEGGAPAGGLAAACTLLHFALWAAAGFAGTALIWKTDGRADQRRLLAIAWGVWLAAMLAADLSILAARLPMVHLWAGSLAGSVAMATYLTWRHPSLAPPRR